MGAGLGLQALHVSSPQLAGAGPHIRPVAVEQNAQGQQPCQLQQGACTQQGRTPSAALQGYAAGMSLQQVRCCQAGHTAGRRACNLHLRLSDMYSYEGLKDSAVSRIRDASRMQQSARECKQEVEACERGGWMFMKSGILRNLHATYWAGAWGPGQA